MEAIQFIVAAYDDIGNNFSRSDLDRGHARAKGEKALERAKRKLLTRFAFDWARKTSTLARNQLTIPDERYMNLDRKFNGFTLPYDFLKLINPFNCREAFVRGEAIYSEVEEGLTIDYIGDVPYNEIPGSAHELFIKETAYNLANSSGNMERAKFILQELQMLYEDADFLNNNSKLGTNVIITDT